MRIPHGRMRSQEKEVHLGDLLDKLGSARFTGCCSITLRGESSSFVFDRGECLLAEYQGYQGEVAWKGILGMKQERADAVLIDLTPEQVEAAVSANQPFLVGPNHFETAARVQPSITVIKPVAAKGMPGRKVKVSTVSTSPTGASSQPQTNSPPTGQTWKTPGIVDSGSDRMSIESLKGLRDSFKADVATLLKDLDLEHLMVDVAEKENVKKTMQDTEKEGC